MTGDHPEKQIPESPIPPTTSISDLVVADNWKSARQRYASIWNDAVAQDWFAVLIYPSSDSAFLREVDQAKSQPGIAARLAAVSGYVPEPHDLLIGIGKRMGNPDEPNDAEVWGAIDAGQFVCAIHLRYSDPRMNWEQRNLLLAAASMTVLCACPDGRGIAHASTQAAVPESDQLTKPILLAEVLVALAASERYTEEGPKPDPKLLIARFCEEHEMTWRTILALAEIVETKPSDWIQGPLHTIEIAGIASSLLAEAHRHVVIPHIAPTPVPEETEVPMPGSGRSAA